MAEIIKWKIVREFIRALWKGHTYTIRKNGYFIFGILWGIPVPFVTIGMGLYYRNLAPTLSNIISEIVANPIHFFFLIHPILFGVVFGAMGTVRDDKEKERKMHEEAIIRINRKLKNTNKKLKELDELKDNFLSMVSHELWSPLTTVQGYLTFIRQEKAGPLSDKQKEILEITEESAEHLNCLVEELIDLSRIEAGKFEVKLDSLDITDVQTKVITSMRRKAEVKNIIIRNELPLRLPHVLADEKRIAQVITNLLGNSIKFTPEGGVISISAKDKNDRIEFSVEDNGIGIPRDKIDKIFDKFYQADSTDKRGYPGCGLGLAITKSIIEMHRGRIWVESEVGKGSRFFFELEKYNL